MAGNLRKPYERGRQANPALLSTYWYDARMSNARYWTPRILKCNSHDPVEIGSNALFSGRLPWKYIDRAIWASAAPY